MIELVPEHGTAGFLHLYFVANAGMAVAKGSIDSLSEVAVLEDVVVAWSVPMPVPVVRTDEVQHTLSQGLFVKRFPVASSKRGRRTFR